MTPRSFKLFNIFDKDEIVLRMKESYTDSDGDICRVEKYDPKSNTLHISFNGLWYNTFGDHQIIE
jgi:hypothetical protein